MRKVTLRLFAGGAACLAGLIGTASAQIPTNQAIVPPAGYPHRTIREFPGVQTGPASGRAAPGLPTAPGSFSALPTEVEKAPVPATSLGGPADPRYRYWSPSTAMWNLQERLNLVGPTTPAGQMPLRQASQPAADAPAILSELYSVYGLNGSGLGLVPLSQPNLSPTQAGPRLNEDDARADETALVPPARPATAVEAAGPRPAGPRANDLEIPFDQFETLEEFRDWLREQLTMPGGGIVGRAMATANGAPPTPGRPTQPVPPSRQAPQYEERPPIGYVGVGSSASIQLGNVRLGQDVATESARLVDELNTYLRQTRTRRRPLPWEVNAESQPKLPPPRSDLGRRVSSPQNMANLNSGAAAVGGATPQIQQSQPRQYWQNLGGYEPPTPDRTDWP
jgi:hypothetical protein